MSALDLGIILAYVGGLFAFGMWTGIREKADDFMVAGRNMPFGLVLGSVVSTWVGVGTTVATASGAYSRGISLGLTAACGGAVGIVVAALVAPRIKEFGDRWKAHTVSDLLAVRYSGRARFLGTGIFIVVYSFLTAAQFVGLAALLGVWTDGSVRWVIVFAAASTTIYTAFAGAKSDFYTDFIHFGVMILVIFGLMLPLTWTQVSPAGLAAALPASFWDPFGYGGPAFFAAGLLFGASSVFVSVEVWQRIYGSRNGTGARWALAVSGVLVVAFYAASTWLGLVTRFLFPDLANPDQALFVLMRATLPSGFLGLGIAGMVAIFVSTLNSLMMVVSTSITKDLVMVSRKEPLTDSTILAVGRGATALVGVMCALLAWAFPNLVALSINSLFSLLVLFPAILGAFYWNRATEKGAILSIVAGVATLVLLTPAYPNEAFAPAALVSGVVFVLASLVTRHASSEQSVFGGDLQ